MFRFNDKPEFHDTLSPESYSHSEDIVIYRFIYELDAEGIRSVMENPSYIRTLKSYQKQHSWFERRILRQDIYLYDKYSVELVDIVFCPRDTEYWIGNRLREMIKNGFFTDNKPSHITHAQKNTGLSQ